MSVHGLPLIWYHVESAAECLCRVMQGRLLATIGSRVVVSRWAEQDDGTHELEEHCATHAGNVYALYCDTFGDFILVGGWPLLWCSRDGATCGLSARRSLASAC